MVWIQECREFESRRPYSSGCSVRVNTIGLGPFIQVSSTCCPTFPLLDRITMRLFIDGIEAEKEEVVEFLLARDGNRCMFPGCTKPFDDDKHEMTFDHIYPQVRAKEDGWEYESIHGVDNLHLMGKSCNTRKGDITYNEDGTLDIPAKVPKLPKAQRPEFCKHCESGRLIFPGDNCNVCSSGPQPATAPGVFRRAINKCTHKAPEHCRRCWVWEPELRTL